MIQMWDIYQSEAQLLEYAFEEFAYMIRDLKWMQEILKDHVYFREGEVWQTILLNSLYHDFKLVRNRGHPIIATVGVNTVDQVFEMTWAQECEFGWGRTLYSCLYDWERGWGIAIEKTLQKIGIIHSKIQLENHFEIHL